jgi:hypothetical protein
MNDDNFEITEVQRQAAKLVIALAAQTGDGKTYSALLLALGLAGGDPSKVGLIDTENRRGSLYADIFDTETKKRPFLILNFEPPHSPARYVAAMRKLAERGIEVAVIDSCSHEHEGMGGLEEIAHSPKADGTSRKIADWITAKREHKKFMNAMLHLPCHVIACFRAREKFDFKNPNQPVSKGLQPITEKNVMFEATASFILHDKGKVHEPIKLPECLRPILGNDGYFTEQHGRQLREWVGGADPIERSKNVLRLAAGEGLAALKGAFLSLDKPTQRALTTFKDTLKDLATHADSERLATRGDNGAPIGGRDMTPEEEAAAWK